MLPCLPALQAFAAQGQDTLGVGLKGTGKRRIGTKKQKQKNRREQKTQAGQVGPWDGGEGLEKIKEEGAAYTQGLYFYTHLYTHLDIVHVKIYAIHTPASCQVPREPAVALVGTGEQMGAC